MRKDKKVAFIISLTPVYILLILELLRVLYWIESIFFWISILFLALMIMPAVLAIIARFSPMMRKSKLLAASSDLMPIYYGFMIVLISLNRDIIPQTTRFDISMTGLGVAIFAIGIALLMQQRQAPLFEELNKNILDLQENTKVLGNKLAKIERAPRKNQPNKTGKKK